MLFNSLDWRDTGDFSLRLLGTAEFRGGRAGRRIQELGTDKTSLRAPGLPSIPAPGATFTEIGIRRAKTMAIALIAPELIILWACRQWFAARGIAKEYREFGWTKTHGFFAMMGGFLCYEDDEPSYTIFPPDLGPYLESNDIDITEGEIQDKSKGDILAKGLVLLQTTWFILQFLARLADHLPVTEIELVTLAFALLNFATYFFWWNKPLNTNLPIRVRRSFALVTDSAAPSIVDSCHSVLDAPQPYPVDPPLPPQEPAARKVFRSIPTIPIKQIIKVVYRASTKEFFELVLRSRDRYSWGTECTGSEPRVCGVSTYYYGRLEVSEKCAVSAIVLGISTAFGAIHCAAWSFYFPSRAEQVLWRTAAIASMCIPLYGFLNYVEMRPLFFFSVRTVGSEPPASPRALVPDCVKRWIPAYIRSFFLLRPILPLALLYLVARLALLVQMFVLLRSASPEILSTVRWTNFIPHI